VRFRQSCALPPARLQRKHSFRFGVLLCNKVAAGMKQNNTQNMTKLVQDPADHRTLKSIGIRGKVRH